LTVKWDRIIVPHVELPSGEITYYKLFMDDGNFGEFKQVSYTAASLTQITVSDLLPGLSYRFKIIAGNFN